MASGNKKHRRERSLNCLFMVFCLQVLTWHQTDLNSLQVILPQSTEADLICLFTIGTIAHICALSVVKHCGFRIPIGPLAAMYLRCFVHKCVHVLNEISFLSATHHTCLPWGCWDLLTCEFIFVNCTTNGWCTGYLFFNKLLVLKQTVWIYILKSCF